jgi:SAM-dependent methyltransferase
LGIVFMAAFAVRVSMQTADHPASRRPSCSQAAKPALFAEVSDALAPGGRFALFDIMRSSEGEIGFPVPWSSVAETSFVDPPKVYREAAAGAGFELVYERDRGEFAKEFFRRAMATVEANGGEPGPIGLHLIMGPTAGEKYGNAIKAAMGGVTAPWEMVFRKVG